MIPQLNEQTVYRVSNGIIEQVPVVSGVRLPRLVQVLEGLSAGDTVMVSGLLQARVGLRVSPGTQVDVEKLEND